jgi:hypothetical protein
MAKMTPLQRALDALDRDLPRSGLSVAAQLEYDRIKPVWERGVPAEVLQSYLDTAVPGPDSQLASQHAADRPARSRTFRFSPRGPLLTCAISFVGMGILVVALAASPAGTQSGLNIWGKIAVAGLVGGCCVWLGISFLRMGLQIRGKKMIIRRVGRTRTVNVSEVRDITLESTPSSGVSDRVYWVPCIYLADGSSIRLGDIGYDPATKPPPKLAATVDEVRALVGFP